MRTRRRMRCLLAQCARRTRCVAGRENASDFIAICARHARARATFSPKNGAARGFTLVEVLVALAIMALMAVMTWRGIDGMARAQQATHEHTDGVLALQAGLGQWRADLDAMMVWPLPGTAVDPANAAAQTNSPAATRSLAWDGSVLRLTRASSRAPGDGVRVVAWARRPTGEWLRWQSAPVSAQNAWASAWEAAARWGQAGAPLLPPGAPAQAGPRLESLLDVVRLADLKRDAKLKVELESYVHLISFEQGRIELRLNDRAPADLPNRLMQRLKDWTGRQWIVSVNAQGAGRETLRDARTLEVLAHPLVKKAMEVFPGAEIVAIRDPRAQESEHAAIDPLAEEDESDEE